MKIMESDLSFGSMSRRKEHQTPYDLTVFGALYFNAEKGT